MPQVPTLFERWQKEICGCGKSPYHFLQYLVACRSVASQANHILTRFEGSRIACCHANMTCHNRRCTVDYLDSFSFPRRRLFLSALYSIKRRT